MVWWGYEESVDHTSSSSLRAPNLLSKVALHFGVSNVIYDGMTLDASNINATFECKLVALNKEDAFWRPRTDWTTVRKGCNSTTAADTALLPPSLPPAHLARRPYFRLYEKGRKGREYGVRVRFRPRSRSTTYEQLSQYYCGGGETGKDEEMGE